MAWNDAPAGDLDILRDIRPPPAIRREASIAVGQRHNRTCPSPSRARNQEPPQMPSEILPDAPESIFDGIVARLLEPPHKIAPHLAVVERLERHSVHDRGGEQSQDQPVVP